MAKQQHRTRINLRKKKSKTWASWIHIPSCLVASSEMLCLWNKKVEQNYRQTNHHSPNHHSRSHSLFRLHRPGDLQDVWETGYQKMDIKHNATFSQAFNLEIRIRNISLSLTDSFFSVWNAVISSFAAKISLFSSAISGSFIEVNKTGDESSTKWTSVALAGKIERGLGLPTFILLFPWKPRSWSPL